LWLFRWCAPAYDAGVGFRQGRKLVAEGNRIVVLE
jgi:hypothetical protein